MKTLLLPFAALLAVAGPAQAASGFRAPPAASRALPTTAPVLPQAETHAPRLFDTCTREGMRKGRYSQYSWCEWFSYFHQNK